MYNSVLHILFFLCYSFLSIPFIYAQEQDSIQKILKSNLSDEKKITTIDSLFNESLYSPVTHRNYAYWLLKKGVFDKSEVNYLLALDLAKKHIPTDNSFIQRTHTHLGYFYSKKKDYKKSITHYQKVIQIDSIHKNALIAYEKLALNYHHLQDYYKAIDYYNFFLSKTTSLKKKLHNHLNLASTYLKLKTKKAYVKGIIHAKKADSLSDYIDIKKSTIYKIKMCLGALHNQNETLDILTASTYFSDALQIALEQKDLKKQREVYYSLGNLYNTSSKDISINYLQKALHITDDQDQFYKYKIYINLGFTYTIHKQYEIGITYTKQSIAYLLNQTFIQNPEKNKHLIYNSPNKENILIALTQLAEIYLKYYEINPQKEFLNNSLKYFNLADYCIDLLKMNSQHFKSRLFWRKLSTDVYGKAIRACYLASNTALAFHFMEKNKSLLLIEDILKQRYSKNTSRQNHNLIDSAQSIQNSLETLYSNRLHNMHPKDSISRIDQSIQQYEEELSSIKEKLNVIPLRPHIASLSNVQKDLNDDQVIVEYHISIDDGYGIYSNQNNGYILFISKANTALIELNNILDVQKDVLRLITLQKKAFTTRQDVLNYTQLAHKLYTILLPKNSINSEHKELIVIPDSFLSFLSFDALTTSTDKLSYLIQQNEIRYLQSVSFALNTKSDIQNNTQLLSIAPINFSHSGLSNLQFTAEEIAQIKTSYSGEALVKSQATKNNFIDKLPYYDIIHLATHADISNDSPWIAFEDKKIYLEELYALKNNASLVVLSACNTSLGTAEIGEGVMNLSRGFFHSGTQSVIASLWNIDDLSTATIFNDFYKNLKSGDTKAQALRKAKLNYLDSHNDVIELSPHYWAAFVLFGHNDTIVSHSNTLKIIPFLLILLFTVFAFLFISKKN